MFQQHFDFFWSVIVRFSFDLRRLVFLDDFNLMFRPLQKTHYIGEIIERGSTAYILLPIYVLKLSKSERETSFKYRFLHEPRKKFSKEFLYARNVL